MLKRSYAGEAPASPQAAVAAAAAGLFGCLLFSPEPGGPGFWHMRSSHHPSPWEPELDSHRQPLRVPPPTTCLQCASLSSPLPRPVGVAQARHTAQVGGGKRSPGPSLGLGLARCGRQFTGQESEPRELPQQFPVGRLTTPPLAARVLKRKGAERQILRPCWLWKNFACILFFPAPK